MADNQSDEENSHCLFVLALLETWDEMSIPEIFAEIIVGIGLVFSGIHLKIIQSTELTELIFLGVGAAIAIPILAFLIRLAFVTPWVLCGKLKAEKERFRNEMKAISTPQKILIEPLPTVRISEEGHSFYVARIMVRGPNIAMIGFKLKILTINPPFLTHDAILAREAISNVNFMGTNTSLNPNEKIQLRLFILERTSAGITFQFAQNWEISMPMEKVMIPKIEQGKFVDSMITFEISAANMPASYTQFKISFHREGSLPPCIIERID